MKKATLVFLLALCLTLVTLPALAAPGDDAFFVQEVNGRNTGVRAEGDTFYIARRGGRDYQQELYGWKVGEEEPSLLMAGVVEFPLSDGKTGQGWTDFFFREGELWGINADAGVVFKMNIQDGKPVAEEVVPLEFEDFVYTESYNDREYTYIKQLTNWQYVSGRLYVIMEDWNSGDGAPHLYSFDLTTGAVTAYESQFITNFAPYQEGKLLCLVSDSQNAYDSEARKYKPLNLSVFDPETDTLTPVGEIDGISPHDLSAMSYDPASDTLYFVCPEKIYCMKALAAPELCAYVPTSYYQDYAGCVIARVGSYVMVNGETGVFVRNADPQYLPKDTLTIYGSYASEEHNKAIAKLDDMPVTFYDKGYYSSAQELGQALVSGENQIDILSISLSYMDFERLMEKGYCYDLSGSEKLSAYVNSLYPFLQEGVTKDGKIFAVPVEMYMNTLGYTAYMKETGLVPPKTFLELCDFVQAWGEEEYYDTFSDYTPFSETNIKNNLTAMAFNMYADYLAASGQELTLDSPILREVLTAAQALDVSDWEVQIDYATATDEDWNELYSKRELLTTYADLNVHYQGKEPWQTAIPITLTEDTPLCISAQVTVLFVNPRSQHLDAAIRYLEAYVDAISTVNKTAMCPGMNEPVENEYFEQNIAYYDEQIENTKKALETAKEADKAAFEEQLKNLQEWRDEYEAENRYTATTESIAAYRALDPYFFLSKPSALFNTNSTEFNALFTRYLQGQISLEQFINEGDAKLRLMRLENE